VNRSGSLRRTPGANAFTTMPARKAEMPRSAFRPPVASRPVITAVELRPGRTRIAPRSKKTAKVYRDERVPLTQKMLSEQSWCGIRWDDRCQGEADALHEILSRGRGGSITDEANCIPACNPCNEAVSGNPAEAEKRGFLRKSGRPSKAVPRG
jgi:hypothetical protein